MGGVSAAARALDLPGHRYQTIQAWARGQIPAEHCPAIERETRARGEPVTCEELRPDVDWAVLRAGASPASSVDAGQAEGSQAGGA